MNDFEKNIYYLNIHNKYQIIQYKNSKYNSIIEKISKIIINKKFYNYEKKILIKELNDLWENLYKYKENKFTQNEKNNFKIDLKKSINKFIKDFNIAKNKKR